MVEGKSVFCLKKKIINVSEKYEHGIFAGTAC